MSGIDEKERLSGEVPRNEGTSVLPTVNPTTEKPEPPKAAALHPAFYITTWITLSSSVILFNKWILDDMKFSYPIILTTWHLAFGTLMTQILARTTTLIDGRKKIKMTGRIYLRAIIPIGFFFSLSLICGNMTYLYLSVAFIQMLKATMPVTTLLATWALALEKPNMKKLFNVSFIVIGVMLASFGEIEFVLAGFLFQMGGVIFEALRLTMVQRLLSSAEYKMDPMVSFYYFAPVCAVMNGLVALVMEVPKITLAEVSHVGYFTLLLNAFVAFGLNVSVVFLIGRTSAVVMTLCGVLKDILLVCASILIWGTAVTPLQFFGYSIALCGMVYYKLGADSVKSFFSEASRRWAEYGQQRPAQRKIVAFSGCVFFILLILIGVAPTLGYNVIDAGKIFHGTYGSGFGAVTGGVKKGS